MTTFEYPEWKCQVVVIEFLAALQPLPLPSCFKKNLSVVELFYPEEQRVSISTNFLVVRHQSINVGNFLVRSAFKTIEKPGTFKCARSRCKTCPFVQNADKISGPKRSVKITDRFTCTSAHYAKSYTLAKREDD